MQLPREPRPGDILDGAWGTQVVRYLRSITPKSGFGVLVQRFAGGTTLRTISSSSSSSSVKPNHPFRVNDATTEDDGAGVTVFFGQVNSTTPTIDGDELDNDDPPVLLIDDDGVIFLEVEVDEDGTLTDATIQWAAELPDDDATHAHLTLAAVTLNDDGDAIASIEQAVSFSLGHERCGVSAHHFWGL